MWSLVPQIFYDLIARVIPGAAVLSIWCLIMPGGAGAVRAALSDASRGNVYRFVAFLFMSYIVGFVSSAFWQATAGRIKKLKDQDETAEKEEQNKRAEEHNKLVIPLLQGAAQIEPAALPSSFVMRDHLRDFAPGEASRLLKIRAERRLCEVLLLHCPFFAIAIVMIALATGQWLRLVSIPLFAVVAFAAWSGSARLHRRYVSGITALWLYYVCLKPALPKPHAHTSPTRDAETAHGSLGKNPHS
jgi:hypothetical protein